MELRRAGLRSVVGAKGLKTNDVFDSSLGSAWSSPTFYTLAFPTLIFPGVIDDSQNSQQLPQFSELEGTMAMLSGNSWEICELSTSCGHLARWKKIAGSKDS